MSIHAGHPDCIRYQKTYKIISGMGIASTLDIQRLTGDMAVHSTISEMRKAGYPIGKAIYVGRSNERRIYAYELTT